MTPRDPRTTAIARAVSALKRVDWVGRFEDIKTVGGWFGGSAKWVWGAAGGVITGTGAWIMSSPRRCPTGRGRGLDADRAFWSSHPGRVSGAPNPSTEGEEAPPPLVRRIARRCEALAANLESERLDTTRLTLLSKNRRELRAVIRILDSRGIPHPPIPPHGGTEDWEIFLGNLVGLVEDGREDLLPTLYDRPRPFQCGPGAIFLFWGG